MRSPAPDRGSPLPLSLIACLPACPPARPPARPPGPARPAPRRSLAHPPAAPTPPPPPPLAAQRHDCRSLRSPRRSFWAGPASLPCRSLIGSPAAQPPSDRAAALLGGRCRAAVTNAAAQRSGREGALRVCLPLPPTPPITAAPTECNGISVRRFSLSAAVPLTSGANSTTQETLHWEQPWYNPCGCLLGSTGHGPSGPCVSKAAFGDAKEQRQPSTRCCLLLCHCNSTVLC